MGILSLESDELHDRIRSDLLVQFVEKLLILQGGKYGLPVPLHEMGRLILEVEDELHIHIEDARVGFGAFDVAAEPEAGVGDAG